MIDKLILVLVASRPSLRLPPLELKDDRAGAAPSWRLQRLSLDHCAIVNTRGKLQPHETPITMIGGLHLMFVNSF